MLTNPENPHRNPAANRSITRSPLLYSSIALAIAAITVCWIMLSRWQQDRFIEQRDAEKKKQERLENDRLAIGQLGGKDLAIQSFYANPQSIHKGEGAQLCYGVANAKTVTLEPQSAPVWPSHARCVSVTPAHTTTYTLTIADDLGHSQTSTVEITVD
jgi:hypothetical protein